MGTRNLYLVFSKPPSRVSDEEYQHWYDLHARENIQSPGFVSARRYAVEPSRGDGPPLSHLALYEYEGEQHVWRDDLDRRLGQGQIQLPDWFGDITFQSFDCSAVSDRIEP